ncbi:MAG: TolB family protein [Planctomycetota bacterium]
MERGRVRNYFYHSRWGAILFLLCMCHCVASVHGSPPETSSADQKLFRSDKGLARLSQLGIKQVVFATRLNYDDPHWYANIGYFCDDENHKAYAGNGKPDESKLYVLDTETGQIKVLLDGKGGGIRDPHVHYDGRTVLFSYRRPGTDCYNLYEIQTDGTRMRQVTRGPYDDFEAMYLPTDDIVFVSTLSKRWVGCWKTQVGTLFRCDRQGKNIRPLSFNPEHDNTPAMLPDGRIIYTRWEYVDRSQVGYHQLWAMNPDGTNVVAYYGNQKHYPLYIDAKAIPGSDDVLVIDSPGHGRSDHRGHVCIITPRLGPDDNRGYRRIYGKAGYNDPYPINKSHFLVASYKQLILGNLGGGSFPVLTYKGRANIHEPIPVYERPREKILVDRTNPSQAAGRMILADVYSGRNMEGVQPGQIKKLLVSSAGGWT